MAALLGEPAQEQLHLLFQPEVSCLDGSFVGAEALVRESRSHGAERSVDSFVRAAELNGEIDGLGEWVLRRACREAAAWPDLFVAVNVSPLQFDRLEFAELVFAAASGAGLPLSKLELEITETARFRDLEGSIAVLGELRRAGVKVALDDFGVGTCDLTYLRRLPIDRLKIDKSFVRDASPRAAVLVRGLISLAKTLDLQVTAEGVETREQFEFLRAAGCDCAQGFFFSAPLTAELIADRASQRPDGGPASLP